jgi:hypothetical protein
VQLSNANGSISCLGIARLEFDGTPDSGFGREGVTCLNLDFGLVAVQGDGAPLFFLVNTGSIHRLLPDNRPSPGFVRLVATGVNVAESDGTANVFLVRSAGHDGAVSVGFETVNRPPFSRYPYRVDSAAAGSDYTADSGRLDWADGDDSPRTISLRILDDDAHELREWFGVHLSEPEGDVQLFSAGSVVVIEDDDAATAPPPGTTPTPSPSGGGGSVSWTALLALVALLFARCRGIRRDRQLQLRS